MRNKIHVGALPLYLNSLYVIVNEDYTYEHISSIYKLKQMCLMGYIPNIHKCKACNTSIFNTKQSIYYIPLEQSVLCFNCYNKSEKKQGEIELSEAVYCAIAYVITADIKKVFAFELKKDSIKQFSNFVRTITEGL